MRLSVSNKTVIGDRWEPGHVTRAAGSAGRAATQRHVTRRPAHRAGESAVRLATKLIFCIEY